MKYRVLCLMLSFAACVPALASGPVNVSHYGAHPNDGVDDLPAIYHAIASNRPWDGNHWWDAPPADRSMSIYFPPGTYDLHGSLALPTDISVRVFGDHRDNTTIVFHGHMTSMYFFAQHGGGHTLSVDGLTFQANNRCFAAIDGVFSPPAEGGYLRTATIRDVRISGNFEHAITLVDASHAVIDQVQIFGEANHTNTGIRLEGRWLHTAGFQLSNLLIQWCNTAVRALGDLEGIYMSHFEFFSCGRYGAYAADFSRTVVDPPSDSGGVLHLRHGKVHSVGPGFALQATTGLRSMT